MVMGKKKNKQYFIHTKNEKVWIVARNRDEAFAKFFKRVEDGKTPMNKLGNIVILHDGKNEYPFRTVPLLFQMKMMSGSDAVSNIMAVTNASKREAEELLMKASFEDSRLIPLINELRRRDKA